MLQILIAITPLFLIIFISALLRKFNHIGDHWSKTLNEFTLYIGLPVLIFSVLSKTSFSFKEETSLIIANSLFILFTFLLVIIIGKISKMKKKMFHTLFICLAFGNIAYLGIPVLTQISGPSILPTASLIVALYLFWVLVLGSDI